MTTIITMDTRHIRIEEQMISQDSQSKVMTELVHTYHKHCA